jgi:hypothetical protein
MALDMSYRHAAASLPREADPADYVVIAGDAAVRTGRVTRDYDASGAYLVLVVVVIAEHGTVLGRRSGADLAATTLELLRTA